MAFLIDQRLAEELQQTTSSHVSFVRAGPANVWTAFTSTLPPTVQRTLVEALSQPGPSPGRGEGAVPLSADFETLVLQLPSSTPTDIRVTLHRSLADAMEPYRTLRVALLALFGVAACVSV